MFKHFVARCCVVLLLQNATECLNIYLPGRDFRDKKEQKRIIFGPFLQQLGVKIALQEVVSELSVRVVLTHFMQQQ